MLHSFKMQRETKWGEEEKKKMTIVAQFLRSLDAMVTTRCLNGNHKSNVGQGDHENLQQA